MKAKGGRTLLGNLTLTAEKGEREREKSVEVE